MGHLPIFACKRPKYTDIGKRGLKAVNFCERPLWTWPLDLYFLFFSSGLALVPAYLHSGVMNGVTTGMGGAKCCFADAQRSSSRIVCAELTW